MLIIPRARIELKDGHTYFEYLIKKNEGVSAYPDIANALGITVDEAKAIYDKVYHLKPKDIGTLKKLKYKPKPKYPYWN